MLMLNVDDVSDTDFKSCLDCVNFSEDGPDGYCKLANHPPVIEFVNDSEAWDDGDMRRCPGFVEDI